MDAAVQYLPVVGFPMYRIGSDGSVWSCWDNMLRQTVSGDSPNNWRARKPYIAKDGYLSIKLHRDGKQFGKRVHRLVAEAFIGPAGPDMEACHNDGNCLNNDIDNLRWGTRSENESDKIAHGTSKRGEGNSNAKLRELEVREIREQLSSGESVSSVAIRYRVSYPTIWNIYARKSWKHIE